MSLNDFYKIGDQMKKHRIDIGLTQKEMAESLDIPRSTYANYEKNKRVPPTEFIKEFADHFNVSINSILGLTLSSHNQKLYFSKNLKNLLASNNKEVNDLVNDLGYEIETVSKWYTGSLLPSDTIICEIARYLNTEPLDFKKYPEYNVDEYEVDGFLPLHNSYLGLTSILVKENPKFLTNTEQQFFSEKAAHLLDELANLIYEYINARDSYNLKIENKSKESFIVDEFRENEFKSIYFEKMLNNVLGSMNKSITSLPDLLADLDKTKK